MLKSQLCSIKGLTKHIVTSGCLRFNLCILAVRELKELLRKILQKKDQPIRHFKQQFSVSRNLVLK